MAAVTNILQSERWRRWLAPWRIALSSLQFKASLLVILLVLIVMFIGLAVTLKLSAEAIYGQALRQSLGWAASLAGGASPLIVDGDTENLVQAVNETLWASSVEYVAVSDAQRTILASGGRSGEHFGGLTDETGKKLRVGALGDPRLVKGSDGQPAYVDVTVPVYSEAAAPGPARASRQVIGYLRLATDVSTARGQLQQMASRLRRISLGVLLLVAPCSLVAMRKVVSPLNELSRTARQLADGVMDARARVTAHNEIGDLARAFNDMAARLSETQFEMLKLNAELEERVQQRTHQLEDLASRDPLTGLYNRRYFSDVIAREFAAAERYDADLTCLMFDLDHFKETNDRFGHRMGDEVLVMVGEAIRAELRDSDVAARFGGDEFIVLLPRASSSAAAGVAERISSRFAEMVYSKSPDIPTTLSVGVASLRVTRARSAEALIHEADLALYAAKTGGRNRLMAARGASEALEAGHT